MRMAAGTVLGWKVGISADSFPHNTLFTTLVDTDALKLSNIEASSSQKVDQGIPKNVDYNLQPGEIKGIQDKLFALNIRIVAYRIPSIGQDEASSRKIFGFAKEMKVETIVSEQMPGDLSLIDKLADEYGINVAICGNLKNVLAAVQDRSKRLGVCGDTGAWLQDGTKPAEALSLAKDRLLIVGLRDRSALGANGHNVALGTGAAEIPQFLREMYRQQIKPSLMTVDGTVAPTTLADMSRSLEDFEKALHDWH